MTNKHVFQCFICMTTDSDGCHVDLKNQEKPFFHFSLLKVIPQKNKFNVE